MKISVRRIIALLLLPCLAADPTVGSSQAFPEHPQAAAVSLSDQAFSVPANVFRHGFTARAGVTVVALFLLGSLMPARAKPSAREVHRLEEDNLAAWALYESLVRSPEPAAAMGPTISSLRKVAIEESDRLDQWDPGWGRVKGFMLAEGIIGQGRGTTETERLHQMLMQIETFRRLTYEILRKRGWVAVPDGAGFILWRLNEGPVDVKIVFPDPKNPPETIELWHGTPVYFGTAPLEDDLATTFGARDERMMILNWARFRKEAQDIEEIIDPASRFSQQLGPAGREIVLQGLLQDGLAEKDRSGSYRLRGDVAKALEEAIIFQQAARAMAAGPTGILGGFLEEAYGNLGYFRGPMPYTLLAIISTLAGQSSDSAFGETLSVLARALPNDALANRIPSPRALAELRAILARGGKDFFMKRTHDAMILMAQDLHIPEWNLELPRNSWLRPAAAVLSGLVLGFLLVWLFRSHPSQRANDSKRSS